MKRIVWLLGLICVIHSATSFAQVVLRDGKEWLQPADFTNLSWNQVEAVCPESDDFLCSGMLKGIDVTGYTFSSVDEVIMLFNSYGIDPLLGPVPDSFGELNSSWAPAFFADFPPTLVSGTDQVTVGWTTTSLDSHSYLLPSMYDSADHIDYADVGGGASGPSLHNSFTGAFLFRQVRLSAPVPKAVPTMPTYVLIFTMLGLIAVASGGHFRRKFKDG